MLNLTELGVEVFIKKAKNVTPYWDNYDLVIWKKDSSGFTNIKGMFRELLGNSRANCSCQQWNMEVAHKVCQAF
jgi:hypothetical protein